MMSYERYKSAVEEVCAVKDTDAIHQVQPLQCNVTTIFKNTLEYTLCEIRCGKNISELTTIADLGKSKYFNNDVL